MDFINLIFKDYDIRMTLVAMPIATIALIILLFIGGYFVSRNKDTKSNILERYAILAFFIFIVGFGSAIGYKTYMSYHYMNEGRTYLSETLKKAYGISLSNADLKYLARDIYKNNNSNENIKDDDRIIYEPMHVTTDQETLITITFVREGEKLTVYKGTDKDMVLMPKKSS